MLRMTTVGRVTLQRHARVAAFADSPAVALVLTSVLLRLWIGIPGLVAACLPYAITVALGWLAVPVPGLDLASALLIEGFVLTLAACPLGALDAARGRDWPMVVRQHGSERACGYGEGMSA